MAARREHNTYMESCTFIISYWSRVSDACRLIEEVLECELILPAKDGIDVLDSSLVGGWGSGCGGRKP